MPTHRKTVVDLHAAKAAARERYTHIAEQLKAEAGIRRHYEFKKIAGLAWTNEGKILAPAGVTRRQLYVLAHECAHIVLHSHPAGHNKPSHVKEHEAETYAHRAFARYDLEVAEKSARWARAYVGQWIMKDRAEGIPICPMAEQFATGRRAPHDPLPAVDGKPVKDFSKQITRLVAEGSRIVQQQTPLLPQNYPTSSTRANSRMLAGLAGFMRETARLPTGRGGAAKRFSAAPMM